MGGDGEDGEGDGEVEATGTAAAGVEVEDAAVGAGFGAVGVAADDRRDAGGGGIEVEIVDGVDEVEEAAGEFDGLGGGELGARAGGVDVTADGCGGGDRVE